jgi:hypothetical protein
MPGDQSCNYLENLSNIGDNDKPGRCLSFSSNKKNNFLNASGAGNISTDNFDKMYFDMIEDVPQNSYEDEYQQLEIHSGSMTL